VEGDTQCSVTPDSVFHNGVAKRPERTTLDTANEMEGVGAGEEFLR
jgi:hypothetical protein